MAQLLSAFQSSIYAVSTPKSQILLLVNENILITLTSSTAMQSAAESSSTKAVYFLIARTVVVLCPLKEHAKLPLISPSNVLSTYSRGFPRIDNEIIYLCRCFFNNIRYLLWVYMMELSAKLRGRKLAVVEFSANFINPRNAGFRISRFKVFIQACS